VGVLVAFIVEGRVLVSYQRGLLDEVSHGLLVALGADVHACLVRRSGGVGPVAPSSPWAWVSLMILSSRSPSLLA
jgi:hypothetical protein